MVIVKLKHVKNQFICINSVYPRCQNIKLRNPLKCKINLPSVLNLIHTTTYNKFSDINRTFMTSQKPHTLKSCGL